MNIRIFTFNFKTSDTNLQQTSTVYSVKTFIVFISAQKTFIEFTSRIVPSFFHGWISLRDCRRLSQTHV